jgi:hypothetical protein
MPVLVAGFVSTLRRRLAFLSWQRELKASCFIAFEYWIPSLKAHMFIIDAIFQYLFNIIF